MQRLIRTLHMENGELFGHVDGRRILLARCEPKIEIMEHTQRIPTIGVKSCSVKSRNITIVLCETPEMTREINADFLQTITRFELSADIQRRDGIFENIIFGNVIPIEIDLDGDWTFEVEEHDGMTKKLLMI